MNTKAITEFAVENGVVGFFDKPITLKSGRQSHFYINWRHACNDAYLLDQLSDYVVDFLIQQNLSFDCIYGVPEGASKLAILTNYKLAKRSPQFAPGSHIIPMGRAKPKEHGKPEDRFFIGQPTGRVLVLEDTITSGLSLFQALTMLREAEINVIGVIGLTDRLETSSDGKRVADTLNERFPGLSYNVLSDASDILPLAAKRFQPSPDILRAIEAEYANHGTVPLKF